MADAGLTDARSTRTPPGSRPRPARSTAGVRSARQAEYLAFARTERANIDAALAWSAAHDPLRALAIANGFGWAWIVLGDSRGAQRLLAALDAAGDAAPARDRAAALLLAAWIEASTGHLEPARRHVAAATRAGRRDRRPRPRRPAAPTTSPTSSSHHGEWEHALALTARSRALYDGPGPAVGPGRERAVRRARRDLGRRPRARAPRRATRSSTGCAVVDDPWLHVRRDAMLGELARVEHRFDDAVRHIGRAAETSARLGFLQTEAYQVVEPRPRAVPGRRLRRRAPRRSSSRSRRRRPPATCGWPRSPASTSAASCARSAGTPRRARRSRRRRRCTAPPAAESRPRSATACSRRSTPRRRAGRGGAARRDPRRRPARDDDAPVEVFALDALARLAADAGDAATARDLSEAADRRMAAASHFITERDRTDARWSGRRLSGARRAG